MRRLIAAAGGLVIVTGALTAPTTQAAATASTTPRWVTHIQRYTGGISNGVRAMYAAGSLGYATNAGVTAQTHAGGFIPAPLSDGPNVQMNDDCNPPLPQNETAVAVSLANPMVAVAAANDYVSGGVVVMRTLDGGRHWLTTRDHPQFRGTGDFCSGGDPAVAYSRRDHAFYLAPAVLLPRAAVLRGADLQVASTTARPGRPAAQAARAATNFDYTTGQRRRRRSSTTRTTSPSTTPRPARTTAGSTSRYTKFHMLPSGFSDYCPLQLSYTDTRPDDQPVADDVPAHRDPARQPGRQRPGLRRPTSSASRRWRTNGALDVGVRARRTATTPSTRTCCSSGPPNGGQTFLPHAVQIDKPGQYTDFMDAAKDDTLPPTRFRAPNTPSLAYSPPPARCLYVYQNNINRPVSKADISYQLSTDGGQHWSDAQFLSRHRVRHARRRNDQFFPWAAADEQRRRSTRSGSTGGSTRPTSASTPGRRRRPTTGSSFTSRRISTQDWNPNLGFFTSGAFIGDYNGLAASATGRLSGVDRRAQQRHQPRTGIGETDIFTNVEIR